MVNGKAAEKYDVCARARPYTMYKMYKNVNLMMLGDMQRDSRLFRRARMREYWHLMKMDASAGEYNDDHRLQAFKRACKQCFFSSLSFNIITVHFEGQPSIHTNHVFLLLASDSFNRPLHSCINSRLVDDIL